MPNPKRRHSRSRSSLRRAHDALKTAQRGKCPRCGQALLPHRICESCGHYKGVEVLEKKED